jgi:hypothetical protein
MHHEYEKTFRYTIEAERERFNEYLLAFKSGFNDEKENYVSQWVYLYERSGLDQSFCVTVPNPVS